MKIGTTRVETFSDGVIAIVITIMVLSVKFPQIVDHPTRRMLIHQLERVLPALVPYAFSFLMIGIFWINHHHMFHLLEHTDESLLRLNLFFLFWTSLIPMATAFISADPSL